MMPFPGGLDSTPNGMLVFAAAAAVLYAFMITRGPDLRRTLVKTVPVALLSLLAAIEGGPVLLVAALALSALGDACLAQDGERAFLAGLASFLAAHIAFAALFFGMNEAGLFSSEPWRLAIGAGMAALALGLLARLWPAVGPKLQIPVAAYAAAILAMGVTALGAPGYGLALGAAAFMASDSLLAAEKFLTGPGSPWSSPMRLGVWVLYIAAQFILTLSIIA